MHGKRGLNLCREGAGMPGGQAIGLFFAAWSLEKVTVITDFVLKFTRSRRTPRLLVHRDSIMHVPSLPHVASSAHACGQTGSAKDWMTSAATDLRRLLSIFLHPYTTHPHNVNKYETDSCAYAIRLTKDPEPPTAANMGADLKDTTAAPAKPKRMSIRQPRILLLLTSRGLLCMLGVQG